MENPIKMDDLGVITTIFGNIHIGPSNGQILPTTKGNITGEVFYVKFPTSNLQCFA